MNEAETLRKKLIDYFQDKLKSYAERSQEEVKKLLASEERERAKKWAKKTGKYLAEPAAYLGVFVGGIVGGAIGLPVLTAGSLFSLPLGAAIGFPIGGATGMVVGAGAGATASLTYSGFKYTKQVYKEHQIDKAKRLIGSFGGIDLVGINEIIDRLLDNEAIHNTLDELNNNNKTKKINRICKDYYKLLKKQALKASLDVHQDFVELDVEQAITKLGTKSSVKDAFKPSKLSELTMFVRNKLTYEKMEECHELPVSNQI